MNKERIATATVALLLGSLFTAVAIVSCEHLVSLDAPDAPDASAAPPAAPAESVREWAKRISADGSATRDTVVIGADTVVTFTVSTPGGFAAAYRMSGCETIVITEFDEKAERK